MTTAVGGSIELVSEENGWCVPPDDPQALAKALHELAIDRHKRERMGIVSRKKVMERFSWLASMNHLEGYYQKMIVEEGVGCDH